MTVALSLKVTLALALNCATTVLVNVPATVPEVNRPVTPSMVPPPTRTDQVGEIETSLPRASLPTAVNCCVTLAGRVAGLVVTTILTGDAPDTVNFNFVAGPGTVMTDVPVFPSLVAVMMAEPVATPVTIPVVLSTVATAGVLLDHVMTRPLKALLLASMSVGLSGKVAPTWTTFVAGKILT